jgi:hypothetical protein
LRVGPDAAGMSRSVYERLTHFAAGRSGDWLNTTMLFLLGGAAVTALHSILRWSGFRWAFGITIAVGVVVFGYGTRWISATVPMRAWAHWKPLVLAEGLCPSCAQTLAGLEPDTDGCVVCPECGSAWGPLPKGA